MKDFSNLYSGIIFDAMIYDIKYEKPFTLNRKIKPAWNFNTKVFGKVFTCKGKPVRHPRFIDDKIRLNMLSKIPKNSVMVYDTECYFEVAHFGELTANIAKRAGCKGVIIDGCTRDIQYIEQLQFPVFCRDVIPIDSFGTWQIVDYNTNILVSGFSELIEIKKDDYIFGDRDGVLVIPNKLINEVYKKANNRLEREKALRNKIKKSKNINLVKEYESNEIH